MKLSPSEEKRLRKKWGPLAEMHLLLREHGWEAEHDPGWSFDDGTVGEVPHWEWTRPDYLPRIITEGNSNGVATWREVSVSGMRAKDLDKMRRRRRKYDQTVEALGRYLQDLPAQQK